MTCKMSWGMSATRLHWSKLIATCCQGLHLSAYSPLGSPDSSSSMGNDDKKKLLDDPVVNELAKKYNKGAGQVSATCSGWRERMSHPRCSDPRGCSLAVPLSGRTLEVTNRKRRHALSQVLIRWGIQHGSSVLPKSVTPERIEQNLHVFDWELSPEDFKKVSSFPDQVRATSLQAVLRI